MKARIKASSIATNREKERARELVREELNRQAAGNTRRLFKLFCLCLNNEYGFGKERLERLIRSVSALAEQHEKDEVFWTHIDQRIEQMGVELTKEDYSITDK